MAVRWVTKKNGNLQKFSKDKLIRGMRRAGCGVKDADYVAKRVTSKCYDKISTRKIGLMVASNLRKEDPKAAVSFSRFFSRNWRNM